MSTTIVPPPTVPAKAPLPIGYDAVQYLQSLFGRFASVAKGAEGHISVPFTLVEWTGQQRPQSYFGHFTQFSGNSLLGVCALPPTTGEWNLFSLRVSVNPDTAALTVDGSELNQPKPPHLTGTLRLHGPSLICLTESHDGSASSSGSTGPVVMLSIANEFSPAV